MEIMNKLDELFNNYEEETKIIGFDLKVFKPFRRKPISHKLISKFLKLLRKCILGINL